MFHVEQFVIIYENVPRETMQNVPRETMQKRQLLEGQGAVATAAEGYGSCFGGRGQWLRRRRATAAACKAADGDRRCRSRAPCPSSSCHCPLPPAPLLKPPRGLSPANCPNRCCLPPANRPNRCKLPSAPCPLQTAQTAANRLNQPCLPLPCRFIRTSLRRFRLENRTAPTPLPTV